MSIEPRVQSIRLARALQTPLSTEMLGNTEIGAIRSAQQPDAGVLPRAFVAPRSYAQPTVLRMVTDAGTIFIELHTEAAPQAVEQVVRAVRTRRYNGLTFHRVVPGFVAQGADPRGDGYGGTEEIVPTELSLRPFNRGSVGIPLAGLDSGGIQLFVVLSDSPHLDGRYPWVGRVVRGMEAVDGIMRGDRILNAEIVDD